MLGADDNENKPIGKPGQRKAKAEQTGKKTEPRRRKERQPQEATPEQKQVAAEQVSASVSAPVSDEVSASIGEQVIAPISEQISAPVSEQSNVAVAATETSASDTSLPAPSPLASVPPSEPAPINFQTIAEAYRDYSRKSFEQTSCFFEKLAGARSLASAFEIQTEFARQSYETFVAQSRRIRELHGELARQRLQRFERLMTKTTGAS
jgi:hypothetical protein